MKQDGLTLEFRHADTRLEKSGNSVLSIYRYLIEILNTPSAHVSSVDIICALSSQGALAHYSDAARGIHAVSLNTLKRAADLAIEGGFKTLDRTRLAAKGAIAREIAKAERSNKINKAGLSKRVAELEEENHSLQLDLIQMTLALERSMLQSHRLAADSKDSALIHRCDRQKRDLLDLLSYRRHPVTDGDLLELLELRGYPRPRKLSLVHCAKD